MLGLIEAAYKAKEDAIAGGPGWVNGDLLDVIAKVPDGTTLAKANLMLQALLAERFGLMLHRERRELPVFALTVGANGPKLTRSKGDSNGSVTWQPEPAPAPAGKIVQGVVWKWKNATMADLAGTLSHDSDLVDRPVTDNTGLQGKFDFTLGFASPMQHNSGGESLPLLSQAIQDQLGLKLEPTHAQVEVLVVDHVEKPRLDKN